MGIQNYYFHMCVQIAHYMMLKGNYSPVSLVFVGIELRRVKSSLFCHIECLYEFKCKKLFSHVSAIVIIHFLFLHSLSYFFFHIFQYQIKTFHAVQFQDVFRDLSVVWSRSSCHSGAEGMLRWMLTCSKENAEWRTPPAVGSTAVLPYLPIYAFPCSSSLN